jgi:peptidoglycan-N-acetylglucosamine deacetylase
VRNRLRTGNPARVEPLALTFDDGPDERGTPALLDALARLDARATFFVIAERAARYPELVERMVAEGHRVGLHCDAHVRHSERDREWLEGDTERALTRLAALGVTPTLWRTPWGAVGSWTAAVAERHGLRLVGWTVDTHDWRGDPAPAIFAATSSHLRPGAIVLAHDGIGPGAGREHVANTVAFTSLAVAHARAHQIELAALA